jgi:hypothetical protein
MQVYYVTIGENPISRIFFGLITMPQPLSSKKSSFIFLIQKDSNGLFGSGDFKMKYGNPSGPVKVCGFHKHNLQFVHSRKMFFANHRLFVPLEFGKGQSSIVSL